MKVFFDHACMSACCWGLRKHKYEHFRTNNRGTLMKVVQKVLMVYELTAVTLSVGLNKGQNDEKHTTADPERLWCNSTEEFLPI